MNAKFFKWHTFSDDGSAMCVPTHTIILARYQHKYIYEYLLSWPWRRFAGDDHDVREQRTANK